jgi:hypothetical protein
LRRFLRWLQTVPHLFGKCMVIACLLGGTGSVLYAFRILSRTDNDPAAALALALAFFGTELGMMFGRDALKGREDKKDGSDQTL